MADFIEQAIRLGLPEHVARELASKKVSPRGGSNAAVNRVSAQAGASPPPQKTEIAKPQQGAFDFSGGLTSPLHRHVVRKQQCQVKELTPAAEKKVALSLQDPEIGFMETTLLSIGLPYESVDHLTDASRLVWTRRVGKRSLTITGDPDFGLPSGKIPRLLSAWICTEAKLTKKREIDLGSSYNDFLKRIGMKHVTGGKNGSLTAVREQALRLFTSNIRHKEVDGHRVGFEKLDIASNGVLLWNPSKPSDPDSIWNSGLKLSENFFESCMEHSAPINLNVIRALKSPMAIDMYLWISYRSNIVKVGKHLVEWPTLFEQFGQGRDAENERAMYKFRERFRLHLRDVLGFMPDPDRYHDSKQGLIITA